MNVSQESTSQEKLLMREFPRGEELHNQNMTIQ